MTWSLNLWGHTVDETALEEAITEFVDRISGEHGVNGGTLNTATRPQVQFTAPEAPQTAPAPAPDAQTPSPDQGDSGPQDAPQETETDTPPHPQAPPLAALSVDELETELNRRSAEGMNVTSDGSALQEASAADIEAEISSRGTPQE